MQRSTLRLAILAAAVLVVLLVAVQLALPPYLAARTENRLTAHGGSAKVDLSAFPAVRLFAGHGDELKITASRLSVGLEPGQEDVFKQLDKFSRVSIEVTRSRAGPFSIGAFVVRKSADHAYELGVAGDAVAGDVARYAGSQLAGGFGQALANLATSALGDFNRPIPFDARMTIDTEGGVPTAHDVTGDVGGLPAGPLAQIVANALLTGL